MRAGWAAAIVVITIGVIAAWQLRSVQSDTPRGAFTAMRATPPGITLQPLHAGGRLGTGSGPPVYADAGGMTLYRYDKDTPSAPSACLADCRKTWRPAVAPVGAQADGDWSIADDREDGRHWALEGVRLYRCGDDAQPGETKCDGRDGDWHMATYRPGDGVAMPLGIGLRELANAGGQAFVDDRNMTLYVLAPSKGGELCADADCRANWIAAAAPEMAGRVGDFAAVSRRDGVRQWTYKGWPLYRFAGDDNPDDANGAGADPRFQVALMQAYFMPADAAISHNAALGDILTAANGMTLYTRDRFIDADGHNFRTDHGASATGRSLGTASCEGDCLQSWHPFKAAVGALPSGYWEIFTRPDGTAQWAYKGYALYFYAEDRAPGDVRGNERYTLNPLHQTEPSASVGDEKVAAMTAEDASRPGIGVGGFFWRAVVP
jgi:predicted lipoprotein with Yx(FWY)xxD motif